MKSLFSWWLMYWLGLIGFSVFSFALTAPNLVYTSWPPFWQFQTWMWQTLWNNRPLLVTVYLGLMIWIWLGYVGLCWQLKSTAGSRISLSTKLAGWLALALPLVVANPALSYDLFNYLFNAKMVVVYHANPHFQVALNFAHDPWTRFMHNIHTPAPYGYGWTGLSLIPYLGGLGKFILTWFNFKMMSLLSLVGLAWVYSWLKKHSSKKPELAQHQAGEWWTAVIVLNPLLLLEVLAMGHNDLWMMAPALWSLGVLCLKKCTPKLLVASLLALAFSISVKLATAVLVPLWVILAVRHVCSLPKPVLHLVGTVEGIMPFLASTALFIPLFTARSQQFHPWYLVWSLVWVPLMFATKPPKLMRFWIALLMTFTLSSLLRYVPYLQAGEYSEAILQQQRLITWSAVPLSLLTSFLFLQPPITSVAPIHIKQNSKD